MNYLDPRSLLKNELDVQEIIHIQNVANNLSDVFADPIFWLSCKCLNKLFLGGQSIWYAGNETSAFKEHYDITLHKTLA